MLRVISEDSEGEGAQATTQRRYLRKPWKSGLFLLFVAVRERQQESLEIWAQFKRVRRMWDSER